MIDDNNEENAAILSSESTLDLLSGFRVWNEIALIYISKETNKALPMLLSGDVVCVSSFTLPVRNVAPKNGITSGSMLQLQTPDLNISQL